MVFTIVTTVRFERDGNEYTRALLDRVVVRPEAVSLAVYKSTHELPV